MRRGIEKRRVELIAIFLGLPHLGPELGQTCHSCPWEKPPLCFFYNAGHGVGSIKSLSKTQIDLPVSQPFLQTAPHQESSVLRSADS